MEGEDGLIRKKPIAYNHLRKIPQEVVEKIIELSTTYQLGSIRITWYLERYHEINVSESSVTRVLTKNGLNRLPKTVCQESPWPPGPGRR